MPPSRTTCLPVVVLAVLDGGPFNPYVGLTPGADEAWKTLKQAQVPVVFLSGRTRAELEAISQVMGVRYPFVAEDGGAFYAPRGYFGAAIRGARDVAGYESVQFGRPYTEILDSLRQTLRPAGVDFVGFSDMSVSEVAADCGLTLLQARLAKLRDQTELLRVATDDPAAPGRLARSLRSARLRPVDCGRYIRVGAPVDLASVADLVIGLFRESFPGVHVVGVADPAADALLLRRVDSIVAESSTVALVSGRAESHASFRDASESPDRALFSLVDIVRRRLESPTRTVD